MELVARAGMDISMAASVRRVMMGILQMAMDVIVAASFLTMDADPETQPLMLRAAAEAATTTARAVKDADGSI
jgi:hypothetical protein